MNRSITVLHVIACLCIVSCSGWTGHQGSEGVLQEVPVSTVEENDTEETIIPAAPVTNSRTVSKGKIESVTNIAVYSQMQEQIKKLNIKDGVSVRRGDVIVELDDERLMNQLVQARNAFEQAEYLFQENLVGQGYNIDETDNVPEYVLRISKVKSGYNTNEASLQQAERNYSKRLITAPVSGTVSDVTVHQYDLPQSTTPLCRIFDPDHLKVVFSILENELGRIEVGSKVSVTTVAYSNEMHDATVSQISPKVDENGMIRVEAELADSRNLIPGMTAFVNL